MNQTGVFLFVLLLIVSARGQPSRTTPEDVKSTIGNWQHDLLQAYKEYQDKDNANMKKVLQSITTSILNDSSDDLKRNLENVNNLCRKLLTFIQESASKDDLPVLNPPPIFHLRTNEMNFERELDLLFVQFKNNFDHWYFTQFQKIRKSYHLIRKYVNRIYVALLPFFLEKLNKINSKGFSKTTKLALPDTLKEFQKVLADIQLAHERYFSQAGLKSN